MASPSGSSSSGQQRWSSKSPAVRRIMQEMREIQDAEASGEQLDFVCQALEDDIFEWHFVIRGPPDTEFAGGVYHGRVLLPPEYPFKPPAFMMLTPNGRFQTGVKICLSISSHHPEHWQPSWSVRTALTALVAFMPSPGQGALGSLDFTKEERAALAARSASEPPKFGSAARQVVVDAMHARALATLLTKALAAGAGDAAADDAAAVPAEAAPGAPATAASGAAAAAAAAAAATAAATAAADKAGGSDAAPQRDVAARSDQSSHTRTAKQQQQSQQPPAQQEAAAVPPPLQQQADQQQQQELPPPTLQQPQQQDAHHSQRARSDDQLQEATTGLVRRPAAAASAAAAGAPPAGVQQQQQPAAAAPFAAQPPVVATLYARQQPQHQQQQRLTLHPTGELPGDRGLTFLAVVLSVAIAAMLLRKVLTAAAAFRLMVA